MTRFARAGKRKFLEASTWQDLSPNKTRPKPTASQNDDVPRPTKRKKDFSKGKKNATSQKSKMTVLDPKKQKQIEARRLRRKKQKCCFVCRERGHQASECPNKKDMDIGNCFKCGSSGHTTKSCKSKNIDDKGSFPFAKCFICKEMGHLARSCPENPRGLYPQGGGCKICGSVEHLKRDCPQLLKKKSKGNATTDCVPLIENEGSAHMSADAENVQTEMEISSKKKRKQKDKVVRF